jgi:hypothetical protein
MLVRIDNDDALDMFLDELSEWTKDITIIKLFKEMYKNRIDNGYFDNGVCDIKDIVDNDYINNCTVIWESDECYSDLKKLADAGEYDISCEENNWGYDFIEAQYYNAILVSN